MKKSKAQPKGKTPKAADIEGEAAKLWAEIATEYEITDSGGLAIIRMGREATVRLWAARLQIEAEGMSIPDRWGQAKIHPLLSVERDARGQVLKALAMLNLDIEPLRDSIGRPPSSERR